ncbi:hypothetical protein CLAIMM_04060 isoform 2 [Cladophialophora immunda]|nr:hypothetical protein CLAIMM_04060 isoform 2 [Cladophialophora immunda]
MQMPQHTLIRCLCPEDPVFLRCPSPWNSRGRWLHSLAVYWALEHPASYMSLWRQHVLRMKTGLVRGRRVLAWKHAKVKSDRLFGIHAADFTVKRFGAKDSQRMQKSEMVVEPNGELGASRAIVYRGDWQTMP